MLNRRRFLTIAAAAAVARPAPANQGHEWTGTAMGAAARVVVSGCDRPRAQRIFRKVEAILTQIETQFSLHRESALTRLNRTGRLRHPDADVLSLFRLAGEVHAATAGVFDPTIQPLWLALAQSGDVEAARRRVGWHRVRIAGDEIALEPGMQVTFNGIAQGFAADRIAALMRTAGFTDVLIDAGEIAGLGTRADGAPWRADIVLPDGTPVGRALLSDRALATSAPLGTHIGAGLPHIVHPAGSAPRWQLAAVSAPRAAVADALSTAFCLMERHAIGRALGCFPGARLAALA